MASAIKAIAKAPVIVFDGLRNFVSGMGSPKDKRQGYSYSYSPTALAELDAMYATDWLAKKIIDIPPQDMTREWRTWQSENAEEIYKIEKEFQVRTKVRRALTLARLYGGAVIMIGDGTANPSAPLDPEKFKKNGLKYLHVFSRHDLDPLDAIKDIEDADFGKPEFYRLTILGQGKAAESGVPLDVKIHRSRFIFFMGSDAPRNIAQHNNFWGQPLLESVRDQILHTNAAAANAAALTEEAKVDVIKIPNLMNYVSKADTMKALIERFTLANSLKSNFNSLLLGGDEDFERKQVSFAGLPELMREHSQLTAAAADIPMTRLFSQSPAGMNATGDSDTRNYYDMLRSQQTTDLEETLGPLDEILVRHTLGNRTDEDVYEWNPLWQLSEDEMSQIALRKSQAIQIYNNLNLFAPEELRPSVADMLIDDGLLPTLDQNLLSDTDFDSLLAEREAAKSLALEEQAAAEGGGAPGAPPVPGKPSGPPALRVVGKDAKGGTPTSDSPFAASDAGFGEFEESEHPRDPKGKFAEKPDQVPANPKASPWWMKRESTKAIEKSRAEEHARLASESQALQQETQKKESELKAKESKKKIRPKKEDFEKAKIRLSNLGGEGAEEKLSNLWEKHIGNFTPEEFKKTFLGNLNADISLSLRGTDGIVVSGSILDKEEGGKEIGTFDRKIDFSTKEAESSYFKLIGDNKRHDIGKKLLGGNVEMYRQLGIEKVKVHANIDVGGYAWAKYGYVPTQSSWNNLRESFYGRLGSRSSSRGSSENSYEAEDWDAITPDDQQNIEREWMTSSRDEFIESEIENWRSNGDDLIEAGRKLADNFDENSDWAIDALDKLTLPEQLKTDTILSAITFNYSADDDQGYGSGIRDQSVSIEFNDEILRSAGSGSDDPNQMTFPGIEERDPSKLLTEEMRDEITSTLIQALQNQADEDRHDIDPPDYIGDTVEELQSEYWSNLSNDEMFEHARRMGSVPSYDLPSDEEDEDAEEVTEEPEQVADDPNDVKNILADGRPKAMWKLADHPEGKRFLLGSDWWGVLDLNDPDTMARFDAYIAKQKKKG